MPAGRGRGVALEMIRRCDVAQRTTSSSRALLEVIVAIVLVVAFASILLTVFGWLVGAVWWIFKVGVLVIAIFLVARLLISRNRSS
jgi:hypothetical protein